VLYLSRVLGIVGVCAIVGGPIGMAPAIAQSIPVVAQSAPAAASTVAGIVTETSGTPVRGATITLVGPKRYTATSDDAGHYAVPAVSPGIYAATVARTGYSSGTEQDVAVVAGQPYTLNIQLAAPTLSSLRVIGSTRAVFSRSTFNTSPAAVNVISTQTFIDQGQPQVKTILNQTPGLQASLPATSGNGAAPGAITFPNIRGGLSFETASLIDGHPVSVGAFGDYVTTFLNSNMLQSIEVVKGPGAAAPEVNYAIGGTVNFRTLDPSRKPTGYESFGVDGFGGTSTNLGYSNTILNGKLGFVLDYAVNGTPGPLNNFTTYMPVNSNWLVNGQQITSATTTSPFIPGLNTKYFNNTSSLLFSGIPVSTTYSSKAELAKIRYNFSNATSLTASYLGSQTWTEQNGNHIYLDPSTFKPGASYGTPAGGPQSGQQYLVQDNIFLPQHEWEINNEPIFQTELRTSFNNNNILARAYSASISRLQYNGLNNPTQPGGISGVQLFGTASLCPVGYALATKGANVGKCVSGSSVVAPTPTTFTGQTATLVNQSAYFNDSEEDRMHGYSIEVDHPFGDTGNVLSIADDYNSSVTGKYNISTYVPGGLAATANVPPSSGQKINTLLVRYIASVGDRTQLTFSNYFNTYLTHYSTDDGATFTDQHNSHYDTRLGLTYRVNPDLSVRGAAGSAIAPPYIGLYSRITSAPVIDKLGQFATNTEANPGIRPETSFGYDLGADLRFGPGKLTVLSGDVYLTNLWNQLISSSQFYNGVVTVPGLPLGTNGVGTGAPVTVPLVSTGSTNLAQAQYEGIELALRRDPAVGFGFTVQGSLQHATPRNVPPSFYTAAGGTVPIRNLGVVPGANFYGGSQGVSNQPIPYSQGYAEVRFRMPRGGLLSFGETYYGNNNSLFVPAFTIANANAIVPLSHGLTLNFNLDNVFNTLGNSYITEYGGVVQPYIGGAQAAIGAGGALVPVSGAQLNANSYGPRNLRVSIGYKLGG
jgi:outer membrane receptor protein involved in Fe transport